MLSSRRHTPRRGLRAGRAAAGVAVLAFAPADAVARQAADAEHTDHATHVADVDGSYRLETGEIVTGGYFVEDGEGSYLFMDTQGLERGGLFERVAPDRLRSSFPPGMEIRLLRDSDADDSARPVEIAWIDGDGTRVRGRRVFPHRSRLIEFTSDDGTKLSGRLLLPECRGPHPLVVSVHGSGPVSRFGGPYHTFFLQHGVAVLAYDKRGYAEDFEDWREPDFTTLAADAASAVRFAAALPEIDPRRVGIFGSSQAGWVAPYAAVDAPATGFLILRAGAAAGHLETILHEVRQELRYEGLGGVELDRAMDLRREIYELAARGAPLTAADALAAPYLDEHWYRVAFGDRPISRSWSSDRWAWMQRNLGVAGAPSLEGFNGSVLWFLGEDDEAVPLVPTRAALERAFDAAPGGDHEIVVLEGARHSFLVPDPADDAAPPRFSPGFFDHMAEWMQGRGLADATCWSGARGAGDGR